LAEGKDAIERSSFLESRTLELSPLDADQHRWF